MRTGKLHLVDLAGSEALTSGMESILTTETRAINVSLTALCDVLQQLSKNARRPHGTAAQPVPYRNHKLTRLLADSLGGNSHTLMIAAVQTSAAYFRSTLTTLKCVFHPSYNTPHLLHQPHASPCLLQLGRFASRARDITTRAEVVSAELSGPSHDAKVRLTTARIAAWTPSTLQLLLFDLDTLKHLHVGSPPNPHAQVLAAKVLELQSRLARREDEIERLESLHAARQVMATREHEKHLESLAQVRHLGCCFPDPSIDLIRQELLLSLGYA